MAFLHAAQQPVGQMMHGMNTIFTWELGWTLFLHGNWDEHFMDEHIFFPQINTDFTKDEHCFCCCCWFRGEESEGCSLNLSVFTTGEHWLFTTDEHWLLHKPTRFLEEPIKCLQPKSSLTSGFHVQLLSPEILQKHFLKDTRPSAADPSEHIWVAPPPPPPSCLQLPASLKQPAILISQQITLPSSLK